MSDKPLPSTMRAWTFNHSGTPSQTLSLKPDLPTPSPPSGSNLLIRVSHAALSSAGLNLMRDVPSILRRNAIPELDFSGTVVRAGPSASSKFPVDTPVFGSVPPSASVLSGVGTMAEYLVVPSSSVAIKPAKISFAEAAGLSSLGQVALEMVHRAHVKSGDLVLVNGGSGGVGSVVVQAAKAAGAEVVATCSEANVNIVRELGADEVIDYRANSPPQSYLAKSYADRPFDAILDTVGSQALFEHSPKYLKPKGPYVCVGSLEDASPLQTFWRWGKNSNLPRFLGGVPRKFVMFSAPLSAKGAEELAKMVEGGTLKIIVDSMFKMEDALMAYERMTSKQAKGKVVVEIQSMDGGHI